MKLLVFSDSHSSTRNLIKALSDHPDAEVIFHLGDGVADIRSLPELTANKAVFTVNGNFEDFFTPDAEKSRYEIVQFAGKKFYLCHGHRHLSSYSLGDPLSPIINQAASKGCDFALFGHTHCKLDRYIPPEELPADTGKGLYLFNPGSISRPRDSSYPSYGIIEIRGDSVLTSHALIGAKE